MILQETLRKKARADPEVENCEGAHSIEREHCQRDIDHFCAKRMHDVHVGIIRPSAPRDVIGVRTVRFHCDLTSYLRRLLYHLVIQDSADVLLVRRLQTAVNTSPHLRRIHFEFRPQLAEQLADPVRSIYQNDLYFPGVEQIADLRSSESRPVDFRRNQLDAVRFSANISIGEP